MSDADLLRDLQARSGVAVTDVASLAVAISRIPYGRPPVLTPAGVVGAWQGTCSTKHLLLRSLAPVCDPAATVELFHRPYRVDRDDAAERWGPAVAATVPDAGLVDVHTYGVVDGLIVDVTFPVEAWDGRTSMPLACAAADGDDVPAGDDVLASKAALVAERCDPAVREPFIAALSEAYGG